MAAPDARSQMTGKPEVTGVKFSISRLPTIRLEHGIHCGPELKILGMVFFWIANVFHIESKWIVQRRELFAAQDDRGRIIVERAAARKLLHLGQHRLC